MALPAFLDKLFGRSDNSARSQAKDRLKLVLMHDRADIPAPMMDQMRAEVDPDAPRPASGVAASAPAASAPATQPKR